MGGSFQYFRMVKCCCLLRALSGERGRNQKFVKAVIYVRIGSWVILNLPQGIHRAELRKIVRVDSVESGPYVPIFGIHTAPISLTRERICGETLVIKWGGSSESVILYFSIPWISSPSLLNILLIFTPSFSVAMARRSLSRKKTLQTLVLRCAWMKIHFNLFRA